MAQLGQGRCDRGEVQRQTTEPGLLRITTAEGEQTAGGQQRPGGRQRLPSVSRQTDPPFPPGTPVLTQCPQDWPRGPLPALRAERDVSPGGWGTGTSTPRPACRRPPLAHPASPRAPVVTSELEKGLRDTPCPGSGPTAGEATQHSTVPPWGPFLSVDAGPAMLSGCPGFALLRFLGEAVRGTPVPGYLLTCQGPATSQGRDVAHALGK